MPRSTIENQPRDKTAKSAIQKKEGHRKWTKGKVKIKTEHAVFVDQATYDRMTTGIPKLGEHISVSAVINKYNVIGSIARTVLDTLINQGVLKTTDSHSKQYLCTPSVVAAGKSVAVTQEINKGQGVKKEKAVKKQ